MRSTTDFGRPDRFLPFDPVHPCRCSATCGKLRSFNEGSGGGAGGGRKMAALRVQVRLARRRWRSIIMLGAVALLATVFVAGSSALVGASVFEGGDGNLVVDTSGNSDWVNAPNLVASVDQPSGTTDNSFGQGTKEDNAAVTVVTGSIPPNKSDLTRFY